MIYLLVSEADDYNDSLKQDLPAQLHNRVWFQNNAQNVVWFKVLNDLHSAGNFHSEVFPIFSDENKHG